MCRRAVAGHRTVHLEPGANTLCRTNKERALDPLSVPDGVAGRVSDSQPGAGDTTGNPPDTWARSPSLEEIRNLPTLVASQYVALVIALLPLRIMVLYRFRASARSLGSGLVSIRKPCYG